MTFTVYCWNDDEEDKPQAITVNAASAEEAEKLVSEDPQIPEFDNYEAFPTSGGARRS